MARDTRRPASASQPADLLELIDRLTELASEGRRVPIGGRIMIDEHDFFETLDQMRVSLPNEISQARRVVQDRQQVILKAHSEAEQILAVARDRAAYMMSERGLMKEARARDEDEKRQTRERTRRSLSEVDDYALGILNRVDEAIRSGLAEIDDARRNIEHASSRTGH